jgi:hypothetical protein
MMRAVWHGVVLAEAPRTIRLEGNHYFPAESLRREFFVASSTKTVCPWKGLARYYTVRVGENVNPDAAWYYPLVAHLVDPAPRGRGDPRQPRPHPNTGFAGGGLGQAHRPDLGVGEGDPRHRPVVGGLPVLAEDVGGGDASLVHRHVREGALAGDVPNGPHPVRGAHPLVDLDHAGPLVQADRAYAESGQIGAPAGSHQ